jgi:hypothetical protein
VLFVGGIAMASMGEFGGGLVVICLSTLSLGSKYWHWCAQGSVFQKTRWVVFPAIVFVCVLFYFMANDMRGDAPWSHLPKAWNSMLLATTVRLNEFPMVVPKAPSIPDPFPVYRKESERSLKPEKWDYLAFVGSPQFPRTDTSGPASFKSGDMLGFNLDYIVHGTNPVQIIHADSVLLIRHDYKPETQKQVIELFMQQYNNDLKVNKLGQGITATPDQHPFFSAYAWTDTKQHRVVTQQDLDDLGTGVDIAYVIAMLTYTDYGVTHHLRLCEWLQPPASPPAIWHFCEGFNHSD